SVVDSSKCIGCASCLAVCPTMAMFIDFGAGDKVQEKMVEYSLAVLKDKKNKAGFINFALKINKECDCWGMENPRIAPDVGILASSDPVSIDKASFDLVNRSCGKDIFKSVHPEQDGLKQLTYAQEIGLGKLDYELIEL
ncbi:4Fe-4S dicluster domain-containing protein, partial [bacterium]